MLPLPNLNNQEYEDIVESALKQVRRYSDSWKDLDVHDPGVTFIELLSYIKLLQQVTINNIGTRSLDMMLKLLNININNILPSSTYISVVVKEDMYISKNTKFMAYDLVFENNETIKVFGNEINQLGFNSKDNIYFIDYSSKDYERNIELYNNDYEAQKSFYISFKNKLKSNEKINIYISILDNNDIKRNPIDSEKDFIHLANVNWQYYGVYNGITGWHDIDIIKDSTYDFLYSGLISFSIKGEHIISDLNGGYIIRAVIKDYEYEVTPIITNIQFNVLKLTQKDTKCEQITFNYLDFKKNKMYLSSYLAKNNNCELFIKNKEFWVNSKSIDVVFMLKSEENMKYRFATSNRSLLENMFSTLNDEDNVFKLILYDNNFYNNRLFGNSSGVSNQEYIIDTNNSSILNEKFEILVEQEDGKWFDWSMVDDFQTTKYNDKKYLLNSDKSLLKFGDNINSMALPIGKNNICVTSLSVTKSAEGNIKSGLINKIENDENLNIEINHFCNAVGGKNFSNTNGLIKETKNILNDTKKAVTLDDYENIAKMTQGLMIKDVTAIALYKIGLENYPKHKADNVVTVLVEPYRKDNKFTAKSKFLENVKRNLEQKKLITTQIFVVEPTYLGVELNGEIYINSKYQNAESLINSAIDKYFNNIKSNREGITIFHGEIYGIVEQLECVESVKYLDLEIPRANVTKNHLGDIKLLPHERAYIKNNNILLINK